MLTLILIASFGQCSGGSCAMPQAGYSFSPQFSYAPAYMPAYQPAAAVAPPQRYRLADSDRQFFTHADPAYLQRWIADRNAAMARPKAVESPKAPPPAATLCPCATGECPCLAKAAKAASAVMPTPSSPAIVALGPPPPEPR